MDVSISLCNDLKKKFNEISPNKSYSHLALHQLVGIALFADKFDVNFTDTDLQKISELIKIKISQNYLSCLGITESILKNSFKGFKGFPQIEGVEYKELSTTCQLKDYLLEKAGELKGYDLHRSTLDSIERYRNKLLEERLSFPIDMRVLEDKGFLVYFRRKTGFSSVMKSLKGICEIWKECHHNSNKVDDIFDFFKDYISSGQDWNEFKTGLEERERTIRLCEKLIYSDDCGSKICIMNPNLSLMNADHVDFTVDERKIFESLEYERERFSSKDRKDSSRVHVLKGYSSGSFFELRTQTLSEMLRGTFGQDINGNHIRSHNRFKLYIYTNVHNELINGPNMREMNRYLPTLCKLFSVKVEDVRNQLRKISQHTYW